MELTLQTEYRDDRYTPFSYFEHDREVEFHFGTDRLDVPWAQRRRLIDNHLFVRPGFPVARPVFPYTSRA